MFTQLLRCLCRCRPGRGDRSASAAPDGASSGRRRDADVPEALQPLLEIEGIGPKTLIYLAQGGYATIEDVRAASEEELAAVEGVGPRAARTLKTTLSS